MNAVIYARYSPGSKQTDMSIEGQLHDCYAFAERSGMTVIDEYIDRSLTGRDDKRSDFQRMINDAKKHQFERILVWKLDRFARNRYDSATYKAKLKKHGVRVISATENITDNPEGILLEGVLETQAEYFSANLSQNVLRGMRTKVGHGLFMGGTIPLGWKVFERTQGKICIERRLVLDEQVAPALRFYAQQLASGERPVDIVRVMTEQGMRDKRGRPYKPSTLTNVLKSRRCIGEYTHAGNVSPVGW